MSGWSKSFKSIVTQEYYLGSCERAHQWGSLNHFVCFDKAVTVSMSKEVKLGDEPKLHWICLTTKFIVTNILRPWLIAYYRGLLVCSLVH